MNHLSFNQTPSFSLENFEGSLELLLYLIQKEEVDVCSVAIQELTQQLMAALQQSGVETNAELMGLAATLLLIKSQKLLPNEAIETIEPQEDPRIEMIEKLIEYCRFRDAATTLLAREQEQKAHFPRAAPAFRKEKGPGLEEVELNDLKAVLLDVMRRAEKKTHLIQDEPWHVAPKIAWFQEALKSRASLPFDEVFSDTKCRGELIVSFLALLEMMKLQKLMVVRENNFLYITATYNHEH